MKPLSVFFLFLTSANLSLAQEQKSAGEVQRENIFSWAICLKQTHDPTFYTKLSHILSSSEEDYHDCHLYYTNCNLDSALKYALLFLNATHEKDDSIKTIQLTYAEAKSLLFRNLYRENLDLYTYLIGSNHTNKKFKNNSCITISIFLLVKGEYRMALICLNECSNWYNVKGDYSLKNMYNNIAACHSLPEHIGEAKLNFQKCAEILKRMNDTVAIAMSYMVIASQHHTQLQTSETEKYFKKSLHLALLADNRQLKQNAYLNMAVVAENKRNYITAVDYGKEYDAILDSLYDRDDVWALRQEQKGMDSLQRLQWGELLQQKSFLQKSEVVKQNLQRNTFVGLAIAFLCFFAFAFYAYRQKRRQNKIITSQREELDALNRTKDQLFSVVAHDLRSPVLTLKATMNKLKTALRDKDILRAEQVAGEIENISNSTYSLLNNLLFWALSQTGQLRFVNDKLNVFRLVEQVLYDYISVAAARHIKLDNCVDAHLYCNGDINTLKIILRNLIDNAIKFSEPFTNIVISGNEREERCVVSVTDSGKGIEDAIIQALDNSSTKRINGSGQSTGIGLWLVKTMTECNGGTLQIKRQMIGTKISILLPLYRNHEQTADTNY